MAVLDVGREIQLPSTLRRTKSWFFASPRTNSPLSSFSSHSSPQTPPHTFSESIMEENIDEAEAVITRWDPDVSSYQRLFRGNRKEAKEFVRSVKELRRAMHFLVSQHSSSGELVRAQKLMQMAMAILQKEFYQILSQNREYLNPESVSSTSSRLSQSLPTDSEQEDSVSSDNEIQVVGESMSEVEHLSVLAMSDLRMIAQCMVSSGYAKECVNIYKIIRRAIVDEGLYHLGYHRYNSSHNSKMSPNVLEDQIKKWLRAVKFAVKTLFHGERSLCDHVFSTSQTIQEACFTEIAKEGALNLFRFPELVAKSKRSSPDNIFLLLDLYEGISELWPEIELIFSFESVSAVRLQALSSLHKLGSSVQTLLSEFESSIQKCPSRTPVLGGGIHPLTISVMNFVSSLGDYSGVLYDIMGDSGYTERSPFPESYFDSPPAASETPASAVSARVAWIILVLLCKLDRKAELYNDIALSYLFLANNIQFVVETVRASSLRLILGERWVSKLDRKVKSFAANYETMAWAKVFSCLPERLDPSLSPDSIKKHFRQFIAAFEDAYRKQTSYVIPDGKFRDEIKSSIAKKLVPMYREFRDTYLEVIFDEKNLVRYSPDDLGNYLSDLFQGISVSQSSSSSSSSSPNSRTSRRCLP